MPLVISDASTLIHLAAIGRLGLLKEFYEKVVVPPSVWREVVEEGKGRAGGVEVERARREGWIGVEVIADTPLVQLLYRDLDAGEAEVIALAVDRRADLVLMDESDARQVASLRGSRGLAPALPVPVPLSDAVAGRKGDSPLARCLPVPGMQTGGLAR
jgi:predicted nucleic acid-binding protein